MFIEHHRKLTALILMQQTRKHSGGVEVIFTLCYVITLRYIPKGFWNDVHGFTLFFGNFIVTSCYRFVHSLLQRSCGFCLFVCLFFTDVPITSLPQLKATHSTWSLLPLSTAIVVGAETEVRSLQVTVTQLQLSGLWTQLKNEYRGLNTHNYFFFDTHSGTDNHTRPQPHWICCENQSEG